MKVRVDNHQLGTHLHCSPGEDGHRVAVSVHQAVFLDEGKWKSLEGSAWETRNLTITTSDGQSIIIQLFRGPGCQDGQNGRGVCEGTHRANGDAAAGYSGKTRGGKSKVTRLARWRGGAAILCCLLLGVSGEAYAGWERLGHLRQSHQYSKGTAMEWEHYFSGYRDALAFGCDADPDAALWRALAQSVETPDKRLDSWLRPYVRRVCHAD